MNVHIMLDIETLSTEPNAMITSIGAVTMDFVTGTLGNTFERQIDIDSYGSDSGFHMDTGTVKWWLQQSKEAQYHMLSDTIAYKPALHDFISWCERELHRVGTPRSLITWGNGSPFDNVVMRTALKKVFPHVNLMSYKNDRCYRTVRCLYPDLNFVVPELTDHKSLDDAMYQAMYLLELHKRADFLLP